ncbi:MAG: hypothetical protein RSE55_02615 [Lachnospiraceae bacterium]
MNQMIKILKRINEILPELVGLILGYGVLAEIIGVFFATDKVRYSIGMLVGVLLAIGMAIHMAVVIEDALSVHDKRDKMRISFKGILRYLIVAVVVFFTIYFDLGSIIAVFIGVMGLKVAAYLQPVFHKYIYPKIRKKEVNK